MTKTCWDIFQTIFFTFPCWVYAHNGYVGEICSWYVNKGLWILDKMHHLYVMIEQPIGLGIFRATHRKLVVSMTSPSPSSHHSSSTSPPHCSFTRHSSMRLLRSSLPHMANYKKKNKRGSKNLLHPHWKGLCIVYKCLRKMQYHGLQCMPSIHKMDPLKGPAHCWTKCIIKNAISKL